MSSTDFNANTHEYISFEAADMRYCIEIASVREIRGWSETTRLPHAPDYFVGVINLRGSVLPVVDLSKRLGMASTEPSARHAIIVLQRGDRTVGLLVDAVADILEVGDDQIEPIPPSASERAKSFVSGIIASEENMVRVLCIDEVIPDMEAAVA